MDIIFYFFIKYHFNLIPLQIEKHEIEQIYNNIESQVIYIDKVVTDLQDFSRPIKMKQVKTNLKNIINDVFASISVPKKNTVSVNISDVPKLRVEVYSLKRVFYNLILNVFQAVPNGGTHSLAALSTDEHVIVTVEDTDIGIPEKTCLRFLIPSLQQRHKD